MVILLHDVSFEHATVGYDIMCNGCCRGKKPMDITVHITFKRGVLLHMNAECVLVRT